jgi:hypothetical protein
MKPAANVANVESKAAVGLDFGKNWLAITVAKLPKIKKSYNSIIVPTADAIITFLIPDVWMEDIAAIKMFWLYEYNY